MVYVPLIYCLSKLQWDTPVNGNIIFRKTTIMNTSISGDAEQNKGNQNCEQKEKGLKIVVNGQQSLSKNQQLFNRLTGLIDTLEHEIIRENDKLIRLMEYYGREVIPLHTKIAHSRIKLALTLGNAAKKVNFSNRQYEEIREAILGLLCDAFSSIEPNGDQIKFYDQWSETSYQEELEQQQRESVDQDDFDDTPEAYERMEAYMRKQSEQTQQGEQHTKRRKTKNKLYKEFPLKEGENIKVKNIRSIYIALVKIFHPDTETDVNLRSEKEEIMKRVTVAYDQKDLSTLLKLEMEWVFKTKEQLDKLTDEKLQIYISALKQQAKELEKEKILLFKHRRFESISRYSFLPEKRAIEKIVRERAEFKGVLEELKFLIALFEKPNSKKQILEFAEAFNEITEE